MKKEQLLNFVIKKLESYPRYYYVFWFFIFSFFIIVLNIFNYTVKDYDFYRDLADKQQIWAVKVPVTRWTIFSATNSWTVLWTSVNLNDLAIDPTVKWDKVKLANFLTNVVYKQTCYLQTDKICYNNILKFVKKLEIENFNTDEKYVRWIIFEWIKEKLSRLYVNSILITDNVDNNKLSSISSLNLKWIYPNENWLYANPEEILDLEDTSSKLSKILWMDIEDLKYIMRKRKLQYIPIINRLSISLSEEINSYINSEKEAIKKNSIKEEQGISNFFILSSNHQRYFPEEWLASQVIWFVDNDWEWKYWIEWYFNDILRWNKWKIVSRNDIKWRIIDPIVLTNNLSLWWADIHTTIDRNIQKKVEEVLENGVKKFRANKWMATIMDPKTWRILAMANYPTYNSNEPWDVYELEKVSYAKYKNPKVDLLWIPLFVEDNEAWKEYIYNSKKILLREISRDEFSTFWPVPYKYKNDYGPWVYQNDTVSALFEPWSIMKPITMAVWIDTWEITKYSTYQDKWEVMIDGYKIKNVARECIWYHDFQNAISFSCNVWMVEIAKKIWKAIFFQYLQDFGFSDPTDITLEWEVSTKMEPYEKWSRAKLFTNSFWLWITVNQLQMATAYNIFANWWVYVKPRIVDYIKYNDWRIFNYKTETTHRVIKKSTSDYMTNVLVESVEKWVAKTWRVNCYSVAWKTWTAVIPYKWQYDTEEWKPWTTNGSFAWYAPAEDPKFVMVITLNRPRLSPYWWWTSSEMFAEIAQFLFDYYGIPKNPSKCR